MSMLGFFLVAEALGVVIYCKQSMYLVLALLVILLVMRRGRFCQFFFVVPWSVAPSKNIYPRHFPTPSPTSPTSPFRHWDI